jgi:hypothetical protein
MAKLSDNRANGFSHLIFEGYVRGQSNGCSATLRNRGSRGYYLFLVVTENANRISPGG